MPKKQKHRLLREMERPEVLGYELDRETLTPHRRPIDVSDPRDYAERCRRLERFKQR